MCCNYILGGKGGGSDGRWVGASECIHVFGQCVVLSAGACEAYAGSEGGPAGEEAGACGEVVGYCAECGSGRGGMVSLGCL